MKRVIGLALFFVAIGILIMMIVQKIFIGILLMLICILVGYNLFCC